MIWGGEASADPLQELVELECQELGTYLRSITRTVIVVCDIWYLLLAILCWIFNDLFICLLFKKHVSRLGGDLYIFLIFFRRRFDRRYYIRSWMDGKITTQPEPSSSLTSSRWDSNVDPPIGSCKSKQYHWINLQPQISSRSVWLDRVGCLYGALVYQGHTSISIWCSSSFYISFIYKFIPIPYYLRKPMISCSYPISCGSWCIFKLFSNTYNSFSARKPVQKELYMFQYLLKAWLEPRRFLLDNVKFSLRWVVDAMNIRWVIEGVWEPYPPT